MYYWSLKQPFPSNSSLLVVYGHAHLYGKWSFSQWVGGNLGAGLGSVLDVQPLDYFTTRFCD